MFGVIASGRLVQTDFQAVSETQFLVNIAEAEKINHIVVFMTGQAPFPNEMGGAVFLSLPSQGELAWHLLGHITNEKPSAIFKISNLKPAAPDVGAPNPFGQIGNQSQSTVAQIGISVEPISQLAQQTPASSVKPSNLDTFAEFSTKMLENLYNYATSFAITQAQMTPNPGETYIPARTIQQWFENFQRKMQQNPYFWK